MIRNSHQLRSARRARDTLRAALEAASDSDKLTYDELIADVQHEIDEYVGIRDGYLVDFEVSSIDGLADALIKARISTGMSQRHLADALGVSEQMVQKDEAGGYERASLTRLADVADALGFTLAGVTAQLMGVIRAVSAGIRWCSRGGWQSGGRVDRPADRRVRSARGRFAGRDRSIAVGER